MTEFEQFIRWCRDTGNYTARESAERFLALSEIERKRMQRKWQEEDRNRAA